MSMTPEILQEIIAGGRQPEVFARTSPNRSFALVTVAEAMLMSHSVEHGSLYRIDNTERLTEFGDQMWSVRGAEWKSDTRLALSLSRYPGNPANVKIDVDLETLFCTFTAEQKTLPLAELNSELDRLVKLGSATK